MTQCEQILEMLKVKPIDAMDALAIVGCMRLSARINDLKKLGYKISSKMVTVMNRYGEECRVAKYSLK